MLSATRKPTETADVLAKFARAGQYSHFYAVTPHWTREPQDDAEPLPADQKHAGQLQPEQIGILLTVDAILQKARGHLALRTVSIKR